MPIAGMHERSTARGVASSAASTTDTSSSSFYLPNNTTVCTFAWIRFRRAGQQGPIRTLTAALKRSIKTVTGCIFYHTSKNITNEKN